MKFISRIFKAGWILSILLGTLIGCSEEANKTSNNLESNKEIRDYEALTLCRITIRLASKDREADVPYVRAVDTGTEFSFAWEYGVSEIKVTTASGQNLRVEGICTVNKLTKEIVTFELAGVKII